MLEYLKEGHYSYNWSAFLYYSRGFIMDEQGCIVFPQENDILYHWPDNLLFNPKDIYFKEDIKEVIDMVKNLESERDNLLKNKPVDPDNSIIRYVGLVLFVVFFSLKIIKLEADYKRIKPSKKNS